MFEIIYKIWCIADDFFAQFITFQNDEDLDDNLYNGDRNNDKTTQT